LSLFDASGNFLASTYFGITCPAGANTVGGNCYDVLLDGGILAPGSYQIAISAFENMPFAENLGAGTLSDGFTGLGNLADGENLDYAYDVILSPVSPTPEPAYSWPGIVILLALLAVRLWRVARGRCAATAHS